MHCKLIFASTLLIVAAAAAPASTFPSDIQLSIQNTEQDILVIINDLAQLRDAFPDFSATGRSLDSLRRAIAANCPTLALPPAAIGTSQAIQYLQQVQLDLNIVSQDIINSDATSATNDICAAVNLFAAAADAVQSATSSASVGPTVTTTGSATASPTGTLSCVAQEDACRTAPDANQAFCSAQSAECQDTCSNAFDVCATAPDANHAYCASVYAGCLGFNPFTASASAITTSSTTTTVSASVTPTATDCTTQENACRTAPNANEAFCSAQAAQCQDNCTDTYDECITSPDANFSFCGSQYAGCLGYNPFFSNSSSTITASASTTAGFACNPAHSYPSPVTCISTNGSLTLLTPTITATTVG